MSCTKLCRKSRSKPLYDGVPRPSNADFRKLWTALEGRPTGFPIKPRLSSIVCVILALAVLVARARAENEGQEDLDKAAEAKISAKTLSDLTEVIRLTESALEKGLDEDNTRFAENLLVSTLIQRGTVVTKAIFKTSPPDARWPQFRHVALSDLEKAVKLSPRQGEALVFIARLNLLPGGDRQRAAEALDTAVELLADEPEKLTRALILRAGIGKDPKKQLADLDEAIRLQPEHGPAYEARALVLADMKKYAEALSSLEKAGRLSPDSPLPHLHKARIHVRQKDFKAALADLEQAEKIAPQNVAVLLLRAGVYEEMGETEKALAAVDRLLAGKPNFVPAMRLRAMLLAGTGNFEEAVAEMEKLRNLQPANPLVLLQLGMFYNVQKKFDKAAETYTAILAADPDNWRALRGRGDARLNLGKQSEAVADFEKALKLEPNEPGTLNNLAWVLATSPDEKLRNGPRAVKLATQSCKLTDYKQAHILSTLAAAYAEVGDFASAVKWAEKGVELADDDTRKPIQKELESYRAGKPWRELLGEEQGEDQQPPQGEAEPTL